MMLLDYDRLYLVRFHGRVSHALTEGAVPHLVCLCPPALEGLVIN